MKSISITSFKDYIDKVDIDVLLEYRIMLYRGQSSKNPLLPSISRKGNAANTTNNERKVLEEFKRRSYQLINNTFSNDWEWLIFAQHYGLKTRLLDWTGNPLTALWFACVSEKKINEDSYVYRLWTDTTDLVNTTLDDPFSIQETKILRPALNSQRIVAQDGWFTAHAYSESEKKFIELEHDESLSNNIIEIVIPANLKEELLGTLSRMGINSRSIFPEINGLCQHLNWEFGL